MPPNTQDLEPETKRVLAALGEKGVADIITCEVALALAADLNVSPFLMGQTLDRLNIKIISCQLGCFGRGSKKK